MTFDPRDPNYRNKLESEKVLNKRVSQFLKEQRNEVLKAVDEETQNRKAGLDDSFWTEQERELFERITRVFQGMALKSAHTTLNDSPFTQGDIDINPLAVQWAEEFSLDLVRDISSHTRQSVQQLVEDFIATPGMTQGDVIEQLEPLFGESRAQLISITETTRAYGEGAKLAGDAIKEQGIQVVAIWNTNNDSRVCPVCGPLNRVRESPGGNGFSPSGRGVGIPNVPAHPGCRCWITHRLV